jgi:hypothetical protein
VQKTNIPGTWFDNKDDISPHGWRIICKNKGAANIKKNKKREGAANI